MLSYLGLRENGDHDPRRLCRAETTRRFLSLELSKYYDVEKNHSAGINYLDLDPVDNRYLLSAGADGEIVVHDLHNISGIPQTTIQHVCKVGKGNPNVHKFSVETTQWYPHDTGMFISSGMDHLLKVWDTNTLITADEYKFSNAVYRHDMSPIATKHCLVAVGCASSKVRLIDLKSGSSTHTLKGHKYPVKSVKWSTKDEFLLATGSEDSRVLLWDIRSSKGHLIVLDQHNGDSAADSNSDTGKGSDKHPIVHQIFQSFNIKILCHNSTLADGMMPLWIIVNTAHDGHVNSIQFTPDGLHLLTFGTDDQLRMWNTSSGRNTNVNFGKISNESRKSIQIAVSQEAAPDMVFVPDDSNIRMLDLSNGSMAGILRGHYNQVNACLVNQETQEVYSGANDRNILVWQPATTALVAYEDYLRYGNEETKEVARTNFLSRVGAADNWSSDEEDL